MRFQVHLVSNDHNLREQVRSLIRELPMITFRAGSIRQLPLGQHPVEVLLVDSNVINPNVIHQLRQLIPAQRVVIIANDTYKTPTGFLPDVVIYQPVELRDLRMLVQEKSPESTSGKVASFSDHLFFREGGKLVRLKLDDVLYFENVGDYVKIWTDKGHHLVYATMKSLSAEINDPRFFRIHRTYLVNLSVVLSIDDKGVHLAEKVLPVSRANRGELLRLLKIL